MSSLKSLAKDTAVYGLSSIIGRFLNWCLVPIYTNVFPADDYGVVTLIYSVVAMAMIILIFGMETGFFRFANHQRWTNPLQVYSTSMIAVGTLSTVFMVAVSATSTPIARWLNCPGHPSFVWMMAIAVGIDAFCALPFSYLRFRQRPFRFATLKLINIGLNIGLNLWFIVVCPWLWERAPESIAWFYNPTFGIGYIFLANLIASAATLLMLLPDIVVAKWQFCGKLLREMLLYSYPILILGVAGIMNQTIDKIIFPWLVPDKQEAFNQLGIYGANYKIAIVMVMFLQAFRFAYEPFIFSRHKEDAKTSFQAYRDAMKGFVAFALLIFLGVMFYLDILKWFIAPSYFSGLKVVPVVMIAEMCFGVFFNLSLWYKLTDKTIWGMWFSLMGLAITLIMNILLVPRFGYMGCAWAALSCYGVMMVVSYLVGRVKYPIGYNLPRLLLYVAIAAAIYIVGFYGVCSPYTWLNLTLRTILLFAYCAAILKIEGVKPSLKRIRL